jgi:hypothetical protein
MAASNKQLVRPRGSGRGGDELGRDLNAAAEIEPAQDRRFDLERDFPPR